MTNWRNRVERSFEAYARLVYRHRVLFALFALGVFGLCISQVPKTTVDTAPTAMLREDSPAMVTYDAFRERFGRDEIMVLAVGPADVFSQEFLLRLKALHEDLEASVPNLDEVTSLMNARNTRGEGDMLVVEDLLEDWPETPGDLAVLRRRVMENPLYENLLISAGGRTTVVAVKTSAFSGTGRTSLEDALAGFSAPAAAPEAPSPVFLTDRENTEAVKAVQEVIARHAGPEFPVHLAGTPVSTHEMKRYLLTDMKKFSVLGFATVALLLFAVFRTLSGVLWPMATVVLALGSTLGIMAATGIPLTMPTQILPSFVMAVGVGDSVHILAIFYRRLRMGDSRENAMAFAMGHSGLAIVLTSVTTAGGLLSFATAEIAPIAHLGIFAATGVLLALFYTLVFLPAMVAIFPPQAPKRKDSAEVQPLDRFLASVGDLATRRPWTILSVTAVLLALGFTGAMNLKFSHDPMRWLPPDAPIRVDSDFISGKLKGTVTMEALVDAGRPGAFHEPKNLAALDTLAAEAEAYHQEGLYVGQTSSVVDVLKEIHQAVNENRPEFYALPGDRRLAAQELLLFENAGSDDLEQLVDPDFSMARLTFKLPSMDAQAYEGFSRHMETRFHEEFGPDVEVRFTGLVSLLSRTFTAVMRTMAESYVIAFGVITLLMILLIGSFRIGLVSMIPNVAPIILCLGLMKLIHVPLNAFTILIGSVAIGLAVDDTIHFMHNFRRYLGMTKSVAEAVHETLQTTGRAMLFTSIVLSCGFYVLCFASMDITIRFGMLTGTAILFALAADFLVAPALMAVIFRKHPA